MLKKILSIAAGTLLVAGIFPAQSNAGTEVPITSIRFVNPQKAGAARAIIIVPEQDTTRRAYGGRLRMYDVHLAKMFEVANGYCRDGWNSVEWHYFAGNGKINMGKFFMDCKLVRDITFAYGTGTPEKTVITYGYGAAADKKVVYLPVLNLNGDKIPKFQNFISRFKPFGNAQRLDLQ
ncbi:hypothetical protein NG798_07690 [Ancylothrix sp. C2]|uniref:hypothetical protein n=1 Tax=Ancylothrix sp. D3o TaxID=2953691 RepID=UPI0021BB345E|nr:hypothetical protein [Ancylothrix sp. D3o]MCT7949665.1 hypothetical protein [Ancylothrix sp. D3o]